MSYITQHEAVLIIFPLYLRTTMHRSSDAVYQRRWVRTCHSRSTLLLKYPLTCFINQDVIPLLNCARRWSAINDWSVLFSAVTNVENAFDPVLGNKLSSSLFLSLVVASCLNLSRSSSVSMWQAYSLSTTGSGLMLFIRNAEHCWRTLRCLSSISWKVEQTLLST